MAMRSCLGHAKGLRTASSALFNLQPKGKSIAHTDGGFGETRRSCSIRREQSLHEPATTHAMNETVDASGGILDGSEVYSLSWPTGILAPHPLWENELAEECALLIGPDAPSWLVRFTVVREDVDGRSVGSGHIFLAEIEAPHCSAYAGVPYGIELRIPGDYPAVPPFVRFASSIDHVLVHDYGDLKSCFYSESVLGWGKRKKTRGILPVVEAVRRMLIGLQNGVQLSKDETKRFWLGNAPHLLVLKGVLLEEKIREFQKTYTEIGNERQRELEHVTKHILYARLNYAPLDAHLFCDGFKDEWLAHELREALASDTPLDALRSILTPVGTGTWALPVFTEAYCNLLVNEVANFESSSLPRLRPNSMNNYGVILNHIGLERSMDGLLKKVLKPLASLFFPEWDGVALDHHHTFVVQYKRGADLNLDPHVDDSEVTLNVCLGKEFKGGSLALCGVFGSREHRQLSVDYEHRKGFGIVHAGKRRHGAGDILSGERLNLIMWGKSSRFRRAGNLLKLTRHPQEYDPNELCLSTTHDRDYAAWKETLCSSNG